MAASVQEGMARSVFLYRPVMQEQPVAAPRRPLSYGSPSSGQDAPVQRSVKKGPKVGRNDPCPCGSGKKYKKCCAK